MNDTRVEDVKSAYEQYNKARLIAKTAAEHYALKFQKELSLIRFNSVVLSAIVILCLLSLVFS